MADFSTPFANNAGRRLPTADERVNGFPCGPADQTLFNGLFHRLESEIGSVISAAGITPTDANFTQLALAIQALIDASTGGGETESYLLLSQARARLPIFPEVNTVDGKIGITSPSTGVVRVPGGVTVTHRGIYQFATVQTDFNTNASRTYHLRWNLTDGFVLRDTLNLAYNPGSLSEDNEAFDSGYDDILLARIVTNSSNVATITNLKNLPVLRASGVEQAPNGSLSLFQYEDQKQPSEITQYTTVTIDFARKPDVFLNAMNDLLLNASGMPANGPEWNIGVRAISRYALAVWGQGDEDMIIGWTARV